MQEHITNLCEQLEAQTEINTNLINEIKMSHSRIAMLVDRVMNLEHYIGLRKHTFAKPNQTRQYDFMALHTDIAQNKRPETLHYKHHSKVE